MCIPVDSMLWALVIRVRDEGYRVSPQDLQALLGSGCSASRAREVLEREAAGHPGPAFVAALETLARVERQASAGTGDQRRP